MIEDEKKTLSKTSIKMMFTSDLIEQNMIFFFFLSMLAVLYIANGHQADKVIRNINKTQNEIKELQYEYKTLKSEVMLKSEASQLAKLTGPMGLKISTVAPKVIKLVNR